MISMAEEPPKEDFSVGPLSLLAESVKKNCQVGLLPLSRKLIFTALLQTLGSFVEEGM